MRAASILLFTPIQILQFEPARSIATVYVTTPIPILALFYPHLAFRDFRTTIDTVFAFPGLICASCTPITSVPSLSRRVVRIPDQAIRFAFI